MELTMADELNIYRDLKKEYFWDVNIEKLDIDSARRLIIERVFSLGSIKEMMLVIDYYGEDEVKKALTGLNYMDPKTFNFVSKVFDIPKNSFKCYSRMQLHPKSLD
jgi:hypothetical protein